LKEVELFYFQFYLTACAGLFSPPFHLRLCSMYLLVYFGTSCRTLQNSSLSFVTCIYGSRTCHTNMKIHCRH